MNITLDDIKKVNDLRKSGNSAEGIVFARNAIKSSGPDDTMAFALSWCLYDEYIKPLYFYQNSKRKYYRGSKRVRHRTHGSRGKIRWTI